MEPIGNQLSDPDPTTPQGSRRSVSTADRDIAATFRAIQEGTLVPAVPDQEELPVCPLCAGHGYLRKDVPVGHPDFGKAFPCQCMEPVLAQRRLERIFGAAAIPGKFAATSFATYAQLPGADQTARAHVEAWADHGPHSLYLHGPFGHGKTGLALAAFRQRIETRQVDALYKVAPELMEAIRRTFDRETGGVTTAEVLDLVKTVKLLLLDDLGKEKPTEWVAEQLYTIVNHRYLEELPLIATSNYTPQQLGARLGQATAWRLVEMSEGYIVKVDGTNLRDRSTGGSE